jgi:flagellar hook-basal body complex protein FliE
MIIPAIGGLSSQLSSAAGGLGANAAEGLLGGSAGAGNARTATANGLGPTEGTGATEGIGGLEGTGASESSGSSFGGALTQAISSLESSQKASDAASQALATGTMKDPEAAISTVEDAALSMQLAAQIRTKAVEATQTIFQTQV